LEIAAKGILPPTVGGKSAFTSDSAVIPTLVTLVREVVEAESDRSQRQRDHEKL
jgi:hypothetical protein